MTMPQPGWSPAQPLQLLVNPGAVPVQQPPPNQATPAPPPAPRLSPAADSPDPRLRTLHDLLGRLEIAKAEEAEAKARAKTLNNAIKNLVTSLFPGAPAIDLSGSPTTQAMRMVWITPRRLDTERLKAEQLDTYNHYLVWADGYWQLKKAGS